MFTPGFATTVDRGAAIEAGPGSSCEDLLLEEVAGRNQVPIVVETLEVTGSTARVEADELGSPLTISLVDEGDRWRISNLR